VEVLLVSREPGGEAFAEEVAAAVVAAVERQRVGAVQAVYAVGEAPELGLEDEVVVGGHQAEGVAAPVLPVDFRGEEAQEEPALVVVEEDRRARDSSRGDVVDARRRELLARLPHPADASG
jgi:hypothetical protein